jgi:acyl carrier protein
MKRTVEHIMADVLKMDEADVADNLTIDDLEAWDSLKHMDLVVSIEQAFKIELTLDEIIIMTSVVAIKRVLNDRGVLGEWN